RQMEDVMSSLCHHSRYAMESELKNGYVTIRGGHRIGMAGQAVVAEGTVKQIGQIHSLSIRVARASVGCAEKVFPYIWERDRVRSTLIAAPPYCGKTTILRDLIRLVSDGDDRCGRQGLTVGVADERSEITGAYQGIPTLAVGARTDVIVGAPKAEAVMMLLRAMSPAVVAMDELGGADDVAAAECAAYMGAAVIATIHARSQRDIMRRMNKTRSKMFDLFESVVFLDNRPTMGTIRCVMNREDEEGG
ncbi:MAG: stage III sporulation protein AA, partial [Selenomonadales bacterium]|nr:stage III sporulation protein AA [Selenomonadales bacterium]